MGLIDGAVRKAGEEEPLKSRINDIEGGRGFFDDLATDRNQLLKEITANNSGGLFPDKKGIESDLNTMLEFAEKHNGNSTDGIAEAARQNPNKFADALKNRDFEALKGMVAPFKQDGPDQDKDARDSPEGPAIDNREKVAGDLSDKFDEMKNHISRENSQAAANAKYYDIDQETKDKILEASDALLEAEINYDGSDEAKQNIIDKTKALADELENSGVDKFEEQAERLNKSVDIYAAHKGEHEVGRALEHTENPSVAAERPGVMGEGIGVLESIQAFLAGDIDAVQMFESLAVFSDILQESNIDFLQEIGNNLENIMENVAATLLEDGPDTTPEPIAVASAPVNEAKNDLSQQPAPGMGV